MPARFHYGLAAMLIAAVAVAGCKSSSKSDSANSAGGQRFEVTLTDDGCQPAEITAKAGPATFVVTNKGAAGVTEMEVLSGGRILGEVENIIEGLSGSFTLNLTAGDYTTYCPGGKNSKGKLTVTGDTPSVAAGAEDPDLTAAVSTYRDYVESQTALLVTSTKALRDAVAAGDVNTARSRYIDARPYYESVEPIAESFGDLDPKIDARADDTPAEQLTGFHRIEYGLWEKNSMDGLLPVADELLANVMKLQNEIPTVQIDALIMANGANELLGEISASKITGEEERYSHIDLVDFEANLEGSRAAFDAVRAALAKRDPDLATTVDARYTDVVNALSVYRKDGTFVLYNELTTDDTRKLAQTIDALGEPLSQVAVALTKPASNG